MYELTYCHHAITTRRSIHCTLVFHPTHDGTSDRETDDRDYVLRSVEAAADQPHAALYPVRPSSQDNVSLLCKTRVPLPYKSDKTKKMGLARHTKKRFKAQRFLLLYTQGNQRQCGGRGGP